MVEFDIRAYTSDNGTVKYENRSNDASGAYLFKPKYTDQDSKKYVRSGKEFYYKGEVVSEAHFIMVDPITSASASLRLRALRK